MKLENGQTKLTVFQFNGSKNLRKNGKDFFLLTILNYLNLNKLNVYFILYLQNT